MLELVPPLMTRSPFSPGLSEKDCVTDTLKLLRSIVRPLGPSSAVQKLEMSVLPFDLAFSVPPFAVR